MALGPCTPTAIGEPSLRLQHCRVPCTPTALRGAATPRDSAAGVFAESCGRAAFGGPREPVACLPADEVLGPPPAVWPRPPPEPRSARYPAPRSARRAVQATQPTRRRRGLALALSTRECFCLSTGFLQNLAGDLLVYLLHSARVGSSERTNGGFHEPASDDSRTADFHRRLQGCLSRSARRGSAERVAGTRRRAPARRCARPTSA